MKNSSSVNEDPNEELFNSHLDPNLKGNFNKKKLSHFIAHNVCINQNLNQTN